ncbi:MAG: CAP domain-containing protein [Pseudomonadota bacterium]
MCAVTSLCALSYCGFLVGCAAELGPPAAHSHALTAAPPGTQSAFADATGSPQAIVEESTDPDQRALGFTCGESDAALRNVAGQLVHQRTDGGHELDADALSYALRAAGAPYVWPRAWLFTGSEGEGEAAKTRMTRWLAGFGDGGVRRCGVAVRHETSGQLVIAAIAVDVLADLEPTPTRVRVGAWLDVRAVLRVPASDAKFVILGPRGAPHAVPTSLSEGRVRARFNADQPGAWLVQLLAAVDGGPRPLLEALVFAGTEPPTEAIVAKAPGESGAPPSREPRTALYAMVNAARQSERLAPLQPDSRLEQLAQAHAEAMRSARKTAHDAGDGDLIQRLERAGLALSVGENVAHGASAALAERALWASPSHRENLLFSGFNLVGIGVAPDPDGTLWVCQVFGAGE